MTPAQAILCGKFWDGSGHLYRTNMPQLWVNGTNDKHFTPPIWQKSYMATPGKTSVCMKVKMRHNHPAGWKPEEIYTFADSILKGGKALATIVSQGKENGCAWVSYACPVVIKEASLIYTKDSGPWPEREWLQEAAKLDTDTKKATATLLEGITAYYFNLVDERDLIVSSLHVTIEKNQ